MKSLTIKEKSIKKLINFEEDIKKYMKAER